jgi:thioredoxin-like negative regulator of GroEL
MPTQLTNSNFNSIINTVKHLALVQFKTEWSGASQIIAPMYNELAKSYKGVVSFFMIDADVEKDLYHQYRIMELPTILFFRNGFLIDNAVGLVSKTMLKRKIEKALESFNK